MHNNSFKQNNPLSSCLWKWQHSHQPSGFMVIIKHHLMSDVCSIKLAHSSVKWLFLLVGFNVGLWCKEHWVVVFCLVESQALICNRHCKWSTPPSPSLPNSLKHKADPVAKQTKALSGQSAHRHGCGWDVLYCCTLLWASSTVFVILHHCGSHTAGWRQVLASPSPLEL